MSFAMLDRRQLLLAGTIGLGTVASVTAADATATTLYPPTANPTRKRSLRLAHLTDTHITTDKNGHRGFAATLKQVHQMTDKPELILFGGDNIMDSFAQTRETTAAYWQLWRDTLAEHCTIETKSCIGNHDVWGWAKSKSHAQGDEVLYGKAWAVEALRLTKPYYSFDQAGWHFIVLDSTHPHATNREAYEARLDAAQYDWLVADLAATPATTPVLVLSHIPILSASAYLDGENEKNGRDWNVPGSWMHLDARKIIHLFHKHRNVKLCLSGHIHLYDRVDYNGVTYLCNGAVSGNWWKGIYHQTPPGYGIVDLFDDGSFASSFQAAPKI
jgi:3',5'-cyclic-AMP phosphodiesterase